MDDVSGTITFVCIPIDFIPHALKTLRVVLARVLRVDGSALTRSFNWFDWPMRCIEFRGAYRRLGAFVSAWNPERIAKNDVNVRGTAISA